MKVLKSVDRRVKLVEQGGTREESSGVATLMRKCDQVELHCSFLPASRTLSEDHVEMLYEVTFNSVYFGNDADAPWTIKCKGAQQ